jgi:hypothetical protein
MGILTQLQNQGSVYAYAANATAPTNGNATPNGPQSPLVTNNSYLHAGPGGDPGYSLNGTNAPTVGNQYSAYLDGVINPLPLPSTLDLNGTNPTPYLLNPPQ